MTDRIVSLNGVTLEDAQGDTWLYINGVLIGLIEQSGIRIHKNAFESFDATSLQHTVKVNLKGLKA